jgi:predicted ABC-type ATPase
VSRIGHEQLLALASGIALQTVFSAPDKVEFVHRARQTGYFVRMFFVATEDPRINAARGGTRRGPSPHQGANRGRV